MLNINTYPYKLDFTLTDKSEEALQKSLCTYLDYKHIVILDSVQSAFTLALSNLQENTNVLCSPNAPLSLFKSVKDNNLMLAYCDLKLDGTMEPRFFKKSLSEHSTAFVLSHNHGIVSDIQAALQFTQENSLIFIEDATQAFAKQEKSGAQLVIHSLDMLIPSTLARGACIATDDEELAEKLRQKVKGGYVPKKFWNYDLINTNADLTLSPLSAQLALDALSNLQQHEKRIIEIQELYLNKLASNRLIELPDQSKLTPYPLFQVALVPALFCPKEDIYQALIEAGVPIEVGNKPIYKTTAYKDDTLSLFGAEEIFKAQLLLPSHHLMTDEDVLFVIETLEQVLNTYGYRGCSF